MLSAGVAQLAEHVLGKDGVTSSILVSSLKNKYARNNHIRVYGLQEKKLHDDEK